MDMYKEFKINNQIYKKNDKVKFVNTGQEYNADEIGVLKLDKHAREEISTGNVGYLISGIKVAKEVKVGDTITHANRPGEAIKGFENVKPMVFAGIYPVETSEFEELRASMEKLQLNDAALVWEPETSAALGFGFRCGFLGLLHMDIAKERLSREFGVDLVATAPNVVYQIQLTDGTVMEAHRPSDFPEATKIEEIREPFIRCTLFLPEGFVGPAIQLCQERRGVYGSLEYMIPERVRGLASPRCNR